MRTFEIEKASLKDNEELCALCEIPNDGNIRISLERRPLFLDGTRIQYQNYEVFVCRNIAKNEIAGMFCIGERKVFLNGKICNIMYFSDLRIHPKYKGGNVLFRVFQYGTEKKILESKYAQTIVFEENKIMLNLVAKRLKKKRNTSWFNYYPAGDYSSYFVRLSGKNRIIKSSNYSIRNANLTDIPAMQEFLLLEGRKKNFYPYYEFNKLDDPYFNGLKIDHYYLAFNKSNIVGIVSVWDQTSFKQTKIISYSNQYKILRPFANLLSRINIGFKLPKKGTYFNYLNLHTILILNEDPKIFQILLDRIFNDFRNGIYDYFLCGLDEKDKLNQALLSFKNKKVIKGKHFIVAKNKPESDLLTKNFYLEVSRI